MIKVDLHSLARLGAEIRLAQLDDEQHAILAAYPDLQPKRRYAKRAVITGKSDARSGPRTPAQRKAHSKRMKQVWAERRRRQLEHGS